MKRSVLIVAVILSFFTVRAERPLFAFDNGLTSVKSVDEQAKLLKDLGYAGICTRPNHCSDELLAAFDKHGVKVCASYTVLSAGAGKTEVPEGIVNHFKKLKGRNTIVWLSLNNKKASIEDAVKLTQAVCDRAAENGLQVVFYPHVGCLTERIPTCMEIMNKAERKNLGLGFTLCHFLALNDHSRLEPMIKEMGKDLKLVLINGADALEKPKADWKRLIQPLNKGSLDLGRLIKILDEIDYKAPVCLQCYKVPGPARNHLQASMDGWKELTSL